MRELNLKEPYEDDYNPNREEDKADEGMEDGNAAVADNAESIVSIHDFVTDSYMGSWLS